MMFSLQPAYAISSSRRRLGVAECHEVEFGEDEKSKQNGMKWHSVLVVVAAGRNRLGRSISAMGIGPGRRRV